MTQWRFGITYDLAEGEKASSGGIFKDNKLVALIVPEEGMEKHFQDALDAVKRRMNVRRATYM